MVLSEEGDRVMVNPIIPACLEIDQCPATSRDYICCYFSIGALNFARESLY